MKFKRLKIKIANVPIEIQIDRRFNNIYNLISQFNKYNKYTTLKIKISKSSTRSVNLSKNFKQINITGNNIDDLTNPFNIIGIMQAIFRFAGIHSIIKNIYLLHGSTSILNKQTLCFGDDGKNMAKTISSIECALISKKYVGDEFCFLNMNNKKIFSYSFIPIHLRPKVKKHFIKTHKLLLPRNKYKETKAGYFIEPVRLFKIIKSKKLSAFIFPHFNNKLIKMKQLDSKQKEKAITACISAHLLKLIYPNLDRMKFIERTDLIKLRTQKIEKLKMKLIKELSLRNPIVQIAKSFPCYTVYIKEPCDITQIKY